MSALACAVLGSARGRPCVVPSGRPLGPLPSPGAGSVLLLCALLPAAPPHPRGHCPGRWGLPTCGTRWTDGEFSTPPHAHAPVPLVLASRIFKALLLCLETGQTLKCNLTSRAPHRVGLSLDLHLKFSVAWFLLSSVPLSSTPFLHYSGSTSLILIIYT